MLQIKPPVWFMALLLFVALWGTPAFSAPAPTFSATASGTTSNLTLTASLSIGDADVGQYGNVYLAAKVGSAWFAHNGADWVSWSGGSLPIYSVGPLANRSIVVVRNANLSALVGTQIYVGYGRSENDMLAYRKYGLVYTVSTVSELNLSRDLLRLGVSANMEPNRPDLDSRPLLQAAVDYIRAQSISRVTLDPGDYYFLTTQQNGRYIYLANLRDVLFAFAGANFYVREAYGLFAMQVVNAERVTLAGFTLDFVELPFTQVRVAQVRPEERTIRIEPMPGYRNATDFNDIRTPNGSSPELHGIAFRNGTVVADTGRFSIARPLRPDAVVVKAESYWSDPATLARILPGDTLVIFGRGAQGTAIRVDGGREVAFEDVDVYASNSIAILFVQVGAARLERVRVVPRPGTDRLISSNADGLNFTLVQAGSVIRNSLVRRTLDDGIAVNSMFLGVVQESAGPSRLDVRRKASTRFENGLDVAFVNTTTAEELGGGRILSQDPPYDAPLVLAGTVRLEFDRALPPVARDFGMVLSSPKQRGQGTVVENNLVEDVLFARGIYLAGTVGVTVRGNTVRRTASAGIVAWQALQIDGFATPPIRGLHIEGNTVSQPMGFATPATGSFAAFGGISVVSAAVGGRFVTNRVNREVTIVGNRILDSGRSGIWVSNVAGGAIRNNVIARHGRRLDLPIVGVPVGDHAQLQSEFQQPVVVRSSDGVEVTGNSVEE